MVAFAFEFFIAMVDLLGNRWIMTHGAKPSDEWRALLAHFVGKDPRELARRVVSQLKPNGRGEVWPPVIADVIALCRPKPEEFGIPSMDKAYRSAVRQQWIHPVVYEAARRIGGFEMRHRSEAMLRPEFEREYAEVCEEFLDGRWTPPKPVSRERQVTKQWRKPSDHFLRQQFAAMRESIGPMPEPVKPEPIPPLNEEEFQSVVAQSAAERDALAKIIADKQAELRHEARILGERRR